MSIKDLTFTNPTGRNRELIWIKSLKSEDTELLWILGKNLNSGGCRMGFADHITKMYLTSAASHLEAHRLRELIEGSDLHIGDRLVEPRLQILRDKIKLLIKNL